MKNVGGLERILRALFGSSLVLLDFFATLQLEIIFLILGLWGVLTSALATARSMASWEGTHAPLPMTILQ